MASAEVGGRAYGRAAIIGGDCVRLRTMPVAPSDQGMALDASMSALLRFYVKKKAAQAFVRIQVTEQSRSVFAVRVAFPVRAHGCVDDWALTLRCLLIKGPSCLLFTYDKQHLKLSPRLIFQVKPRLIPNESLLFILKYDEFALLNGLVA